MVALELEVFDFRPSLVVGVAGMVGVLITWFLMPQIAKLTIRYEDVGPDAP
jgi:hypothetical protein